MDIRRDSVYGRDPSNGYISIIKAISIKLNDMDKNIASSNGYVLIWVSAQNGIVGVVYARRNATS